MASSNDVRDMLGLSTGGEKGAKPPPLKKQKSSHKPLRGMNREVHALIGERAAPIAIIDPAKTYQRKLGSKRPAKRWVQQSFRNKARQDGLILRHWVPKPTGAQRQIQDGDTAMGDVENRDPEGEAVPLDEDYKFAKYDISVETPQYDEEQYNAHLKSAEWSKEETDYLLELVRDYHLRWPVIADRWDFVPKDTGASQDPSKQEADNVKAEPTEGEIPNSTSGTGDQPSQEAQSQALSKPRTMEDLKARYYSISATLMALAHPVSNMNDAEFALHSTLTSYSAPQETTRKKLAASMLSRGIDELKEEEYLIAELQRIMTSQQRLEAERAELRARLDTAPMLRQVEGDYSSSAALNELFQRLINSSRSAKRSAQGVGPGGRLSLSAGDMLPSPAYANGTPMSANARDSFSKRGSIGGPPGSATSGGPLSAGVPLRQISPKAEKRFGITPVYDVKNNQNVTFPSDRVAKSRAAKSAVQTAKLNEMLLTLKIPEILPLQTAEVAEAFEELVGRVTRVNEARRVLEREEGDVKVVRNRRRESGLDGTADEEGDVTMASAAADDEDAAGEEEDAQGEDEDAEGEDEDADGEADDYEDAQEDAEGEENDDAEGEVDDDDAEGEDEDDGLGEQTTTVAAAQLDGAANGEEAEIDQVEEERPESSSTRPGTAVSQASLSTRASRKRSASVLSAGSRASSKRLRR